MFPNSFSFKWCPQAQSVVAATQHWSSLATWVLVNIQEESGDESVKDCPCQGHVMVKVKCFGSSMVSREREFRFRLVNELRLGIA